MQGSAALFLLIAVFLVVGLGSIGLFLGLFKLPVLSPPVKVTNPTPVPILVQTQTPAPIPAPTPVPNLKFLTFNDQKLGLEFQYPKSLTAKEDSEEEFNKRGNGDFRKNFKGYVGYEPGKFLGAVAVLDKDQNFDTNPFSVWIFDNPDNLTVDAWFSKYWYYPFLWGVFDYTSKGHVTPDKEATISGKPAKSKIISYQPGKPKYIYISSGTKIFLVRILTTKESVGNQILSSLKFLDQQRGIPLGPESEEFFDRLQERIPKTGTHSSFYNK